MATQTTTASNVKLIFVSGIGPIIGTTQGETTDAIVLSNPCQFGLDETGELVIRDYLEGITDATKPVVFLKYNIVSINEPAAEISNAYVSAIEALLAESNAPTVFMPAEKKIII